MSPRDRRWRRKLGDLFTGRGQKGRPEIRYATGGQIFLMGATGLAVGLALLASLVAVLPVVIELSDVTTAQSGRGGQGGASEASAEVLKRDRSLPLAFGLFHVTAKLEGALLILVIVAGALGSYMHVAGSFAAHISSRDLKTSWRWWYVMRLLIGPALACVFYLALRGGFLSGDRTGADVNPHGVAALAGLVGLFSKQATDKLKEVFEILFRTAEAPDRASALEARELDPATVTAGSADTEVTVRGSGFSSAARVLIGDEPVTSKLIDATQLAAIVPAAKLADPGTLSVVVRDGSGDGQLTEPLTLTVTATGGQLATEAPEGEQVPEAPEGEQDV